MFELDKGRLYAGKDMASFVLQKPTSPRQQWHVRFFSWAL
jgi:hypothetical protein